MFTRASLVAVVLGLLVVAERSLGADDARSPAVGPEITALLPDDAISAFVLYPRRIFRTAPHLKDLADLVQQQVGLAPDEVEQFIGVFGYPRPEDRTGTEQPFKLAVIVRLAAPHGGEEFVAKWLAPAELEKRESGGKSYYRASKGRQRTVDRPECVALLGERTLVAGSESDVRQMLNVQQSRSPLVQALATVDPAADYTQVLANRADIRQAVAGLHDAGQLPPPLLAFSPLADLLDTMTVSVKSKPDVSVAFVLVAKDAAGAEKVAAYVPMVKELLNELTDPIRNAPRAEMPPDQKEFLAFFLDKLDKIIAEFKPRQSGNRVTVEIGGLGSLDEWASKATPSINAARRAGQRVASANNLKQLGLAMNNYHTLNSAFPRRAIFSKDGKALLSWRVAILPMIDQQPLYKQFHLDEPWDSEHNKPLVDKMPALFADPQNAAGSEGKRRYVVPVGKDTVFEADKAFRIDDITDGASNTLLLVEVGADKSVVWTKPDDMDFDPQRPRAGFGTISDVVFMAAFCDGHIQAIRKNVDAETLRRLIIRNDGQPVDPIELQSGVSKKPGQ